MGLARSLGVTDANGLASAVIVVSCYIGAASIQVRSGDASLDAKWRTSLVFRV
ncbi:hypothetical protein [Marinagarivorans cellulosilyticus]|uniref:hypothetical protein n=1 Tax=Marinagarivorans cellulosilyticus TaxID=2721545 RepID=UPI001F22FFF1|nr:hypothetical protein [Marinagarivorans cellulosilyticus]